MASGDGTIISDGSGNFKISKGGEWVDYTGPKPGATKGQGGKIDKTSEGFLNKLSEDANSARETSKLYDRAEGSLKAINPGPYRNSLLLSPAIPEDDGGWADKLGAMTIGGVAKVTGAVTPNEVSHYQTVRAIQNAAVLERQLQQKGVQTNTDAQRMMLADISANKGMRANQEIIDAGRAQLKRRQARAVFYTQFANKFGLNGLSPHGYTVDQLWATDGDRITKSLMGEVKPEADKPGITIISRTKVR